MSTESKLVIEVEAESMAEVVVSWAWGSPWGLAWMSLVGLVEFCALSVRTATGVTRLGGSSAPLMTVSTTAEVDVGTTGGMTDELTKPL